MEKDIEKARKRLSEFQQGLFKTYRHEFDSTKQVDENGDVFWYARDLAKVLDYPEWYKFFKVFKKAINSLESFSEKREDHIRQVAYMVELGSGAKRKITDYKLTFYACGLIVQAADGRKKIVAAGQAYFIIQTAKMEALEKNPRKIDTKWSIARQKTIDNHKSSAHIVSNLPYKGSGNKYAHFHDAGNKGLFKMSSKNVARRHGLEKNTNIWAAACTDLQVIRSMQEMLTVGEITKRDVNNVEGASQIHYDKGDLLRKITTEAGLPNPENMPLKKQAQLTSKTKLT